MKRKTVLFVAANAVLAVVLAIALSAQQATNDIFVPSMFTLTFGEVGATGNPYLKKTAANVVSLKTGNLAFDSGKGISGVFGSYNGVATVGNGVPSFVGQGSNLAFFAAVSSTNLVATTVASVQRYRIGYYLFQKASGSGGTCASNATATVTLAWTDPGGASGQAQTKAFSAMNVTPTLAAGAYQSADTIVVSKASSALTYSIAWANGNCSVQPTASIYLYGEALN